MDCKHINIVINKISTEKLYVKKILCEIIKYKSQEKQNNSNLLLNNNDISQKTQTIFMFLMLQLYTFKTLCDVPHNKFNNILCKKLNKISSNLIFFKKLFHFAIINVALNHSEKKLSLLMYTWFKKIIYDINVFYSKIKSSCDFSESSNSSVISSSSSREQNIIKNSSKCSLSPEMNTFIKKYETYHQCTEYISNEIYSKKFVESINNILFITNKLIHIINILNKNIDDKMEELKLNENDQEIIFSDFDYELINKMIYITFLHFEHLSNNMNNLIKKFCVNSKNNHHVTNKTNTKNSHKNHLIQQDKKIANFLFYPVDVQKENIRGKKSDENVIIIKIGSEISQIQFISCHYDFEKIIDTLSKNKINIENITKLLNMNNTIATYFISIVSDCKLNQ